MLFGNKPLDQITEDDLLSIIGVSREGFNVDFKRDAYERPSQEELSKLKGPKQNEKAIKWRRDLCTDVSALANASGGWIICGIEEVDGQASKICGLGKVNTEEIKKRLEENLMRYVEPQIMGLQIHEVNLSQDNGEVALVIRVPDSFSKPHRNKDTKQFHIRRSKGNDEMTVQELRQALNQSAFIAERARAFRRDRVQAIDENREDEIPVKLAHGLRLITHIVPFSFIDSNQMVDMASIKMKLRGKDHLSGFFNDGIFNLDGLLHSHRWDDDVVSYYQIYRSGAFEAVHVIDEYDYERKATLNDLESHIVNDHLLIGLDILNTASVNHPLLIFISFAGSNGWQFAPGANRYNPSRVKWSKPSKKSVMLFPDVTIEQGGYDKEIAPLVKPILDVLWNMAGYEKSPNFDTSGSWRLRS